MDALVGLTSVPSSLSGNKGLRSYNLPLTGADMVFYKTSSGVLADQAVRQALNEAVNVNQIILGLGYPAIRSGSLCLMANWLLIRLTSRLPITL